MGTTTSGTGTSRGAEEDMRSYFFRAAIFCLSAGAPWACAAQYIINLSERWLQLPGVDLTIDSVVTSFPDRDPIGAVMRGPFNRQEAAYLQVNTDIALTELVQRSLHPQRPGPHFTMKVNAFEIREGGGSLNETAACSLHAEFLQQDSGRWVRVYDHGTTVSGQGMDVTYLHGSLIEEALSACITSFWERFTAGKLSHDQAGPLNERTPVASLHLPVLDMKGMRRGLYHSFQDFRCDRIDTVPQFEVKYMSLPGEPRVRIKLRSPDIDVQNAWGCSDGSRLYVNAGRCFIELKPEHHRFTTFMTVSEPLSGGEVAGAMVAGFLFGMMGAGVVVGVAYDWHDMKCDLDLLTGAISPFNYSADATAASKTGPPRSRHVFGFSKYSTIDTTVCLYVDDGLEACLSRKQYYDFRPVRRAETMVVEFRVGTNAPVKVELDTNDADDKFFLIKVTAKGEVDVDRVSDEMAIDLLEHLDPGMEVKHQ